MTDLSAWVFGVSSGIGTAIGTQLRTAAYHVVGFSRRPAGSAAIDEWYYCDVTERARITATIQELISKKGPPRVLVYCAGKALMGQTLQIPADAAREAFEVNFWGLETIVQNVLPEMSRAKRGTILAILSLAALRPVPYEAYYAASKAAAARWLECLCHESRRTGVSIKYLCPGYVDTGFFQSGGWHGMQIPEVRSSGLTAQDIALEAIRMLNSRDVLRIVGWREKAIRWVDRVAPRLFDEWLARRELTSGKRFGRDS